APPHPRPNSGAGVAVQELLWQAAHTPKTSAWWSVMVNPWRCATRDAHSSTPQASISPTRPQQAQTRLLWGKGLQRRNSAPPDSRRNTSTRPASTSPWRARYTVARPTERPRPAWRSLAERGSGARRSASSTAVRCLVMRAGSGTRPSIMATESTSWENRAVPAVPSGAYRRYALVYDLVWRAAPYDRFVDLCLEAAAAQGTGVRRVLVAACGTGNAALELAGRGLEVAGFDLSPAMVAVAAAKPRPAGRPVGLVVGDLRAAPVRDGWAALVLALNAGVNYLLEPAEGVAALRPP